jgi:hypothetical protein
VSSEVAQIRGKQEIVLIGIDMNRDALTEMLDRCLLTDSEVALGESGWKELQDPFSPWQVQTD